MLLLPTPQKQQQRKRIRAMSSTSPAPEKLRLQVVVAAENDTGQLTDVRKFLHITNGNNNIDVLHEEVNEKFKHLYPAEKCVFHIHNGS
jgi:Cdc14 phosphatase binding protein N-terminus